MPSLTLATANVIIRVMAFAVFFLLLNTKKGQIMAFTKYTWVGNRISKENMASLYKLKTTTRKPITKMVSEAVELYLSKSDLMRSATQESVESITPEE